MPNKLVLLVEDDPDHEFLALRALHNHPAGFEVAVVRDGPEVLDFVFGEGEHAGRAERPLPDLILLDLHLPKLNGLEVLGRIRSNPRSRMVPVVIFTTSVYDVDVRAGYQAGANSYVRKPLGLHDGIACMVSVIEYWLTQNTVPRMQDEASAG